MRRLVLGSLKLLAGFALGFALVVQVAHALPFNDDMVNNQLKTGQIMRPRVAGTVSRGSLESRDGLPPVRIEKRDDVANLTNPRAGNPKSVAHGRRLFQINCLPCHGNLEAQPWEAGVAGKVMKFVPNLTNPMYHDRTDGSIYGTIHFGSVSTLMPAYGWKLSPGDHWDLVSYFRFVQGIK